MLLHVHVLTPVPSVSYLICLCPHDFTHLPREESRLENNQNNFQRTVLVVKPPSPSSPLPRVLAQSRFFMPASLGANQRVRTTRRKHSRPIGSQGLEPFPPRRGRREKKASHIGHQQVNTAGLACSLPISPACACERGRKRGREKKKSSYLSTISITAGAPGRNVGGKWRKKSTPNKEVIHFNEKVRLTNTTDDPAETRGRHTHACTEEEWCLLSLASIKWLEPLHTCQFLMNSPCEGWKQ